MNRKNDKFSLILENNGQGNRIAFTQKKDCEGCDLLGRSKTLHKVAEECNLFGRPEMLNNIFLGKKEKSEETLQFNDQDCK